MANVCFICGKPASYAVDLDLSMCENHYYSFTKHPFYRRGDMTLVEWLRALADVAEGTIKTPVEMRVFPVEGKWYVQPMSANTDAEKRAIELLGWSEDHVVRVNEVLANAVARDARDRLKRAGMNVEE